MKFPSLPLLCLALLAFTAIAHAAPSKPAWKLVWADEFNKDGAPDPANWGCELGFIRNQEEQWYQKDNAFVQDGKLIIEARRQRVANPNYDPASSDWTKNRQYAEYTSSSVTTGGKHSWLYGRFEMRAKLDTRVGMWPAFWALGTSFVQPKTLGDWPFCGEVDMMEYCSGNILANAVWAADTQGDSTWKAAHRSLDSFGDPNWSSKFHVWRMDWDPNWIRLYVDGALINQIDLSKTIDPDGTNPFHKPMYLLLNLAIGANGGDPSQTVFPARYAIDYVRVYQKQPAQ